MARNQNDLIRTAARVVVAVVCATALSVGGAQERAPLKLSYELGIIDSVAKSSSVRLVKGEKLHFGPPLNASGQRIYLLGAISGPMRSVDVVAFASMTITSPKGEEYVARFPVNVRDLRPGEVRFVLEQVSLPSIVAAQITEVGLGGELIVMSCRYPTTREYTRGAQSPKFDVEGDESGGNGRPWIFPEIYLTSTAALSKQPGFESFSDGNGDGTYAVIKVTPRSKEIYPIQLCVSMELQDDIAGSITGARLMDVQEGETGYALCFLGHTDAPETKGAATAEEDFVRLERPAEGETNGTLHLRLFMPTSLGTW